MSTLELIELIALGAIAVGAIIYFGIKAIKNGWIKKLKETIEKAIHEAEESGKAGQEKLQFVMGKVREKCIELGIPYDFLQGVITKLIKTIVANHNIVVKGHE